MRAVCGQRLGEEARLAAFAHGLDAEIAGDCRRARDRSRQLSEAIGAGGFSYTQNIVWGPNEIDVCMWIIDAENWRRQASSLINAVLVRNALGLALSRQHTHLGQISPWSRLARSHPALNSVQSKLAFKLKLVPSTAPARARGSLTAPAAPTPHAG